MAFAELFAVSGFAIAQPLLSVLGESPDLFIFRDATPREIVVLGIAIILFVPLALWVCESLIGLAHRGAARAVHVTFVAVLLVLLFVQIVKRTTAIDGIVVLAIAGAAAAGGTVLYIRSALARLWLLIVSPAPVAFLLLFLLVSPVSNLVFPEDAEAATLGSPRNAPSVVMIVFDEWPLASIIGNDGQIDAAHYPNLARLAGTSTWYRNATSVTNSTWHALPHLLTGRLGESNQVPEASFHPENLFTFLGGTYRLRVSEVVTRLCPRSLCNSTPAPGAHGLARLARDASATYREMIEPDDSGGIDTTGFEERTTQAGVDEARHATHPDDRVDLDLGVATANRPERFDEFLRGMNANEAPTLHFLHLLLPHVAYRFLPSGLEYPAPADDFAKRDDTFSGERWPTELAHQRLLLQAAYTDRLVGALLDQLEETGLDKRTAVVVMADHGIAFDPNGPGRGLSESPLDPELYDDVLSVPMFVRAAGQTRGEVSDANVMAIDVVPTIAKLVGFDLPWKVDGEPAGDRTSPTKIFRKATVNPFGVEMDPSIEYGGAENLRRVLASHVDAITMRGDDALQFYRIGPNADLVGKRADTVALGATIGGDEAQVHGIDAYERVDRASGSIPALLYGEAEEAREIVVIVNGVIAGVSPTFRDGDVEHRFAVMIPEPLLRDGANTVELKERR